MGLRAAYLAMHRRTSGCLARCGVTADQFVLLALLTQQDGITQQELARRASSDPNTIRAMLVLLENRGLVARGGHATDRRARCVTLTTKGRQRCKRLSAETDPVREQLAGALRPDEAETLVDRLARISEAMGTKNPGLRRRRSAGGDAKADR